MSQMTMPPKCSIVKVVPGGDEAELANLSDERPDVDFARR